MAGRSRTRLAIHGGQPVRKRPWPLFTDRDPFIDERDVRAAMRAVCSRQLFRYDLRPIDRTEVGRFEAALRAQFGTKHALALSSGTAAIALGLIACGVNPGDEVACPGYTFAATPSAILLAGARPVLIEVDDNLHLDVADLQRKLSKRMKAIVVVHMAGYASDMEAVLDVARRCGLPVVEDAVPILGGRLRGRLLGTFGTVGAFSTQSDKTVNTGEGGFLVTEDTEVYARALLLAGAYEGRAGLHFKRSRAPIVDLALPLFNFRMDEIRGAVAAAQLRKLPRKVARLARNHRAIAAGLESVGGIALRRPVAPDAVLGAAMMFRLPGAAIARTEAFAHALRAEGVFAIAPASGTQANARCFWNWKFLFPATTSSAIKRLLPTTVRRLEETIAIPLPASLEPRDREDLIDAVAKVVGIRGAG